MKSRRARFPGVRRLLVGAALAWSAFLHGCADDRDDCAKASDYLAECLSPLETKDPVDPVDSPEACDTSLRCRSLCLLGSQCLELQLAFKSNGQVEQFAPQLWECLRGCSPGQ